MRVAMMDSVLASCVDTSVSVTEFVLASCVETIVRGGDVNV